MTGTLVRLTGKVTEFAIQKALDGLPNGGTLLLPAGQTIAVSKGLFLDVSERSITLDLNGSTLQQAGDAIVLEGRGRHVPGEAAKLSHDAKGHTTVTFDAGDRLEVGSWVKIYSDDKLPNDHGAATRLGQAMQVTAVRGDTATLAGELHHADLYRTNVRASAYESGELAIVNGTVRGDQRHDDWLDNLVQLRTTVEARIDGLIVRDGNSMGINVVNSVHASITQSAAINLADDTPNGHYGYGVHSASSLNTTVDGFYAEKVRHATDNNSVGLSASSPDPSKYGADIGMTVKEVVAWSTTASAFSWHTEGRFGSISDSMAFDSTALLVARGLDNQMSNVSGVGNERGIAFYEYGKGDARRIEIEDVRVKEAQYYAAVNQGGARENTITGSVFESLKGALALGGTARVTDTIVSIGARSPDERIVGTGQADRLLGGKGVDRIEGGQGNDYLWGGLGADVLSGGAARTGSPSIDWTSAATASWTSPAATRSTCRYSACTWAGRTIRSATDSSVSCSRASTPWSRYCRTPARPR